MSAKQLRSDGKLELALEQLRAIEVDFPEKTEVLFLIGLTAIDASGLQGLGQPERNVFLDEAIVSFHEILVNRPELIRVRLELARAFFLKGEDELAKEHFEVVLATEPQPAITANIRRFLKLIDDRKDWRGRFSFSIVKDDNINSASEDGVTYIFGLPFRRSADADVKSSTGIRTNLGFTKFFALDQRTRMVLDGDLDHTEHKGSDLDQSALRMSVGPDFNIGSNGTVGTRAIFVRRFSAGQSHSGDFGWGLNYTARLSDRIAAHAQTSWLKRDYDADSRYDGTFTNSRLSANAILSGVTRFNLSIGHSRERPMLASARNTSRLASIGFDRAFAGGIVAGANVQRRWTRFNGRCGLQCLNFSEQRRDRTTTFQLSATNRQWVLFGFSPKLTVRRELRDSRAQLGDYKRTTYDVLMVRQF